MKITEYIKLTDLNSKSEVERAKLVCYYFYKEKNINSFDMLNISEYLVNFGYNKPNCSRLKNNLIKGKNKYFIVCKSDNTKIEFIPAILELLDDNYGEYWDDKETIDSSSEVIDEMKFCGKRNYLTKLIQQINASYKNNCYDACAVLIRRLFEVLLILAFQNNNIDHLIKDRSGTGYFMLDKIVEIAKNDPTLKISRNKMKYDEFRKIGNFSAHGITYIASSKDIDDIKIEYRVMLEELYNKAGLL